MVKLMIVDDHRMIREAVRLFMDGHESIQIVGEAVNGEDALEKIDELRPDVILMDVQMAEIDGIRATEIIRNSHPEIRILGFSMLSDRQSIYGMLQAGASGFLLKNTDKKEIIEAVEKVGKGGNYYCKEASETVLTSMTSQYRPRKDNGIVLSSRESEVMRMVMKEFSNAEIADKLGISIRTVEAHKRNIIEKTGSRNLAGAILYAVRNRMFADLYEN